MTTAASAILLAGGRAARLDGIDKPLLQVDGITLLERALEAVADCAPVIVVGPRRDRISDADAASLPVPVAPGAPRVVWVREEPPFSGPAAAIATALDALHPEGPEWVFVLATDLVHPAAAVTRLREGRDDLARQGHVTDQGFCLADDTGRPQWLTGLYRTGALRGAARALPRGGADAPARALLGALDPVVLEAPAGATADLDTWDDVARVGARVPDAPSSPPTSLPKETR